MPIIIIYVQDGSPADHFGVKLGWRVHSINNQLVEGMTIDQAYETFRLETAALSSCVLVRQLPIQATSVGNLSAHLKVKSVKEAEIVAFLCQFGFLAKNAKSWGNNRQPRLLFWIDSHSEMNSPWQHTWYAIMGNVIIDTSSSSRQWMVRRRLAHIRALLHDPVKRELSDEYNHHFKKARFARHGGLPGTTARMQSWFAALAKASLSGAISPALMARIICFLEAPTLHEHEGQPIPESKLFRANSTTVSCECINAEKQLGSDACDENSDLSWAQDLSDDAKDQGTDDGQSDSAEACAQDVLDGQTDQGTDDGFENGVEDWLEELDSTDELPAQAASLPAVLPMDRFL